MAWDKRRRDRVDDNGESKTKGKPARIRAGFARSVRRLHHRETFTLGAPFLALGRKQQAWVGAGRTAANVALESLIRTIPDFPLPGILFRDITPLLKDPTGFREMIDLFVARFEHESIGQVVAIEARGYMLGAPLAYRLGAGFVPVRKPGKLPAAKHAESYTLEYGTNSLEIHDDAVGCGERVVVVDDLLATGGTAAATGRLLERLGAHIVGFAFLIELSELDGRRALQGYDITTFLRY